MLHFDLTGSIGCVLTTAPDELTLAISSLVTRDGAAPSIAWVLCVAREAALRNKVRDLLREGDVVRIEGHVKPRRRQVGELAFQSVGFIAHSIERLPPPDEGGAT